MTVPRRRWSAGIAVSAACGFAAAVALSIDQGRRQRIGHDFAVFWQAGRDFATGHPLYSAYLPGARQFKYPPFAALVFQPLGWFPLQVAAALFSLLNLVLWVVAVVLTRDILARTLPDRRARPLPLALAVVLTAQFFLDNFHHVQVNGVVFVLVLLGVRACLRGRDGWAAAPIVAATAMKLTPVFFAAWLVLRGRRRAALAIPPLALACVLVPLLLRGPATGTADLVEYYHTFLEGHQHGEIGTYVAGQNLAGLVNRMMRPAGDVDRGSYDWLPASERVAQHTYQALWVAVLLLFVVRLAVLRRRGAPPSALELSLVFLTALLLSPITFTTHLVSLLFVFATFLSLRPVTLPRAARAVLALILLLAVVIGLSGRDLAGDRVYLSVGGYSVIAWTMLLMLGTAGMERTETTERTERTERDGGE